MLLQQAFVAFAGRAAGRARARLAVRPAPDHLGVVRAPRRVQRDPPGRRRARPAKLLRSPRRVSRGEPPDERPVSAVARLCVVLEVRMAGGIGGLSSFGSRGRLDRSGVGRWRRRRRPMRSLGGSAVRSRTLRCARSRAHRPPSPRRPAVPISVRRKLMPATNAAVARSGSCPIAERPRERLALRGVGGLTCGRADRASSGAPGRVADRPSTSPRTRSPGTTG